MKTKRTGIIIFTGQFEVLKSFYKQVFDFPVQFDAQWEEKEPEELVCFNTGSGYLLLETPQGQDRTQSPAPTLSIRFNIDDVSALVKHLDSLNIIYTYSKEAWGESLLFQDPDGNKISIRDEATFLA